MGGSGVGAYIAQVDRVLGAAQGVFPTAGGPGSVQTGGPGVPAAPADSALGTGASTAGDGYKRTWGAVSAVFGFPGQIKGLYNALNVIARAAEISPQITAMGFAESFTTTLYGLTTLLVAAILWFVLNARYRRLAAGRNG